MFPKESDESENITKCFTLSSTPFGMLEQYGGNVGQVPERRSKNRSKTLPSLCGISLDKGRR